MALIAAVRPWAIGVHRGQVCALVSGLALTVISVCARAEYTDSCAMFAQTLSGAAEEYDSKRSTFKSACDPYTGYDKNDETACGEFGYLRTAVGRARRNLEDAINNVAQFCGTYESASRASRQECAALKKENSVLQSKNKTLESENEKLRATVVLSCNSKSASPTPKP